MSNTERLRAAAQAALECLESLQGGCTDSGDGTVEAITVWCPEVIEPLRAALAEDERDWSLLEATQESLREHMAEVQRLRAALAQPATIAEWWAAKQAASGEQAYFVRALHGGKGDLDAWLECYDETEVRAHVLALVHQPTASGAQADLIAGALYDLMGYLTSRDETIRLGATELATPAVDALVAFAAKRGLSLDNPAIADWSKRIAAAAQPVPARAPLTDEQIDMITAEQWGRGLGAPYAAYRAYARAIEATLGIKAKEAP